MKTTLQFIFLFFLPVFLSAQPVNNLINDVVMPPPNAASLGKYGDIPVSYYSGVPSISIPIHTVVEGNLSVPVSLSYHAGGMKVSEMGSWVGLGWSLNAGGMISRSVLGRPDERSNGYLTIGSTLTLPTACQSNSTLIGEIATGNKDGEPDIFSFSVGGYNGKFFFRANGSVVLVPLQDVKVTPVYLNGTMAAGTAAANNFKQFIITTPDGTKYYFGDIDDGYPAIEYMESPTMFKQANGWYMKKVESADGKFKVTFNYVTEYYSYKSTGSKTWKSTGSSSGPLFNTIWMEGKRLNFIASSTDSVKFIPGPTRQDLSVHPNFTADVTRAKELDKINIKTVGSGYCKTYDLQTSYFVDNSIYKKNFEEDKRLRLDTLRELSCAGTPAITNPPHIFNYFVQAGNANFLPNQLSRAIDHWGYYNGADGNNNIIGIGLNIPYTKITYSYGTNPVTYVTVGMGKSNRETSEAPMKLGTLEKITYPTGGYTQFDYEANDYWDSTGVVTLEPTGYGLDWYWPTGQCQTANLPPNEATYTFTAAELPKLRYTWMVNGMEAGPYCTCTMGNGQLTVTRASNNQVLRVISANDACNNMKADTTYGYFRALVNGIGADTLIAGVAYKFSLTGINAATKFFLEKENPVTYVSSNHKVGG